MSTKNLSLAVCRILPMSQASCEHARASEGVPVALCSYNEACLDKTILKEFSRTRTPKSTEQQVIDLPV